MVYSLIFILHISQISCLVICLYSSLVFINKFLILSVYVLSFKILTFIFHLPGPFFVESKFRYIVILLWSDLMPGVRISALCALSKSSVEIRNLSRRLISLYVNCFLLGCIFLHISCRAFVVIKFLYVVALTSLKLLFVCLSKLFSSVKLKSPPKIIFSSFKAY